MLSIRSTPSPNVTVQQDVRPPTPSHESQGTTSRSISIDATESGTSAHLAPTTFHFAPVVVAHEQRHPEPVTKRRAGRPKGSVTKAAAMGPKRPPGRPKGTGKHQREAARLALLGAAPKQIEKRKRGRPRKAGEDVSTRIDFGRFLIPGTRKQAGSKDAMQLLQLGSSNAPSGSATTRTTPSLSADPASPIPPQASSYCPVAPALNAAPGETSPQFIDIEEDDDENEMRNGLGVVGDGLGDENDDLGDQEGDEVVDGGDDEGDDEQVGKQPASRTRVRHILPSYLLDRFNEIVKENSQYPDTGSLSSLDARHTGIGWAERTDPLLQLLAADNLTPTDAYSPLFYIFDPIKLCRKLKRTISCPTPGCTGYLNRHTHLSRPRRVVDIDESFWIVGYRYRCAECRRTFRSFDEEVIKKLPSTIQPLFPADLSHRSGISLKLLNWERACLRGGMSGKQISDALRVQHLIRYDGLRLQYYRVIKSRSLDRSFGKRYMKMPSFEDRGPYGYQGFVPSAQWLMKRFDKFIARHRAEIYQGMALLSLIIGAMDHSFKIPKHIRVVNGERPFVGLHMISNEFSEIRGCHLVTTKGNSQVRPALEAIKQSLDRFGLEQPQVFYTDNMADKAMLEEVFPSLRTDVVPVDKYSHLRELEIPEDVVVYVKRGVNAINTTVQSIMDDLAPDGSGEVVVGFDSEWNVETAPNGRVKHVGKTAVVQIAYKQQIYILQVSDAIARGDLPAQLKAFLSNPRVRKVGRLVNGDLRRLELACSSRVPFCGGVDLSKYAKDRGIFDAARAMSLADLCAMFLGKRLRKLVPERLSDLWEDESLSSGQIKYAAGDAYASLRIFDEISRFEVPRPLATGCSLPATPVLLYSGDRSRFVATGQISLHSLPKPGSNGTAVYDGIKLDPHLTAIEVFSVILPGAKLSNHRNRCLQDFGTTPFTIVVPKALLRVYQPTNSSCANPYSGGTAQLRDCSNPSVTSPGSQLPSSSGSRTDGVVDDFCAESPDDGVEDTDDAGPGAGRPLSELIFEEGGGVVGDNPLVPEGYEGLENRNPQYAAACATNLGQPPSEWSRTIHSRVLKDAFHVFNQFYISAKHGMRLTFARKLSYAIFLWDEKDRAAIEAWAATQDPPTSFDELRVKRSKWLLRHCKRIIPPPGVVYPRVRHVFEEYGTAEDATTRKPLFDANNWKIARNILELIAQGYLSDPPGVALYSVKGIDRKTGLTVYHCFRGTNRTEGGIHTHLRTHLPSSGTSIEHAQASLDDHVLHHNTINGHLNRTGRRYRGHFDVWVTNELQELMLALDEHLDGPEDDEIAHHVNGNFYAQTSEVVGVLPIPLDIQRSSGMREFNPLLDGRRRHHFLSSLQGVSKAVLPVHTAKETALFTQLMQVNPSFNTITGEPVWQEAVRVWNRMAELNDELFYKLVEQLKAYFAHWKVNVNIKATLANTREMRHRVDAVLSAPSNLGQVPQIPERHEQPRLPSRGLLSIPTDDGMDALQQLPTSKSTPGSEPSNGQVAPSPVYQPASTDCSTTNILSVKKAIAKKRTAQHEVGPLLKKKKAPRTCMKCGSQECAGRRSQDRCEGSCTLCGSVACYGQNSRKRGRGCGAQVWP